MNVLFVLSIGKFDGGAAAVWMNLLDGLPSRGVKPYVVIPQDSDHSLTSELDKRAIPWKSVFFTWWVTADPHPHSIKRRIARAGAQRINTRAEREIGTLIDVWNIDLVYLCDGTITAGIEAARSRSLPVVWHFHQFIRGSIDGISFVDSDRQVNATLAKATRIITVSRAIADDMERRFSSCRAQAIPNGIPESRIYDKQDILQDEGATFTLVGRIDENKRQLDALAAFERVASLFAHAQLIFVGTGQEALELRLKERIGASKARAQIKFSGYQSDMASVWRSCDIALNCSYSEGCSMVIAEAMSSGCLVLCSSAEGNVELIESGTGLLYERCDIDALAGQMRWVLEHPNEARELARAGKRRAAQLFDIDAQIDAVYEVFAEVLS